MNLSANAPFYILNIIIHFLVYLYFIIKPFKKNFRFGIKVVIPVLLVYVASSMIVILTFFEKESIYTGPINSFIAFFVWVLGSFGVCVLLIKGNPMQLLFLIFVTFGIQNNVISISNVIFGLKIFPNYFSFEYANYIIISIVVLILYIPVMRYIYIKLFKQIIDSDINFSNWKYMWIIPFCMFTYTITTSYGGVPRLGPFNYRHLISVLSLSLLSLITYIVTLQMLVKNYDSIIAKGKEDLMHKQLEIQKEQYKKLTTTIKDGDKLRHDWRHHIHTISGLAERNDVESIKNYLSKYQKEHLFDEDVCYCDNAIIDSILGYYAYISKQNNIAISIDVQIPADLDISDLDLCVVFGNLIENATEACLRQKEGERFIKVVAKTEGGNLLISVKNSFDGKLEIIEESFYSSKREGEGIGISSVRSFCEKNGGMFYITSEDYLFCVRVILNGGGKIVL